MFGIGLNYLHTSLSGAWNDKWSPQPVAINGTDPATYNSSVNQYELLLDVNISKLVAPLTASDKWNIFIRTGPGLTTIKDNIAFYTDQLNIKFNRFSFAFEPGVSFRISDRIKFKAGTSMRIVFSDNLDGVHLFSSDPGWSYNYSISEIYQYTYLSINYCLARKITVKHNLRSGNRRGTRYCN